MDWSSLVSFPCVYTVCMYHVHSPLYQLFSIAGNQALLSKDPLWKELVDHCKDRKYMVYRNECKKFPPPQGQINQVNAVQQRKQERLRMPMPKAHTHMLKPVSTDCEDKKEINEAVEYYNELMTIVKFLVLEHKQLSSLTVTIE